MYLRNERIRKLPLVIDAVMVSDVEDTRRPQQLYMVYSQTLYPGLGFKKGYVYGGEHGIEKVFVKKIAGLDHVYAGRRDLVTVNGSVEGIVYNGDDVAVSVLLPNGYHSLVLITCSTGYVHRFEEIVKGFTSKKRYTITRIDLGLSGSTIIALLKTIDRETNAPGPSYLFLKKTGSNYNMRALSPRSVVAGSNGLYTGVFEVVERKDKRQINLHLVFNGRYKRYRLKNDIVKPEFIRQDSLVYASNDTLIASDGASIYTIDLKKNRVLWSKELGVVRCASVSPIETGDGEKKIVVAGSEKAYILSIIRGVKLVEFDVEDISRIGSCSICEPYIALADGSYVSVYSVKGEFIGNYYVEGSAHGVSVYGNRLLIGYVSPANIPKAILADFLEGISVKLYDVKLTVGGSKTIEVESITPSIRVLKTSSRRIRVYSYGSYIVFRDEGAEPGEHYVELLLSIHGFLPLREVIRILLEKPLSVFTRISVSSRVREDRLGLYLPVTLETPLHIDVLKMTLWSSDNNVYGTTHEIIGLPPGEHTIPIRILWATAGIHEVSLNIVSWSHAKKFVENIRAKIIVDKDWFKPVLRVYSGLTYLWSPVNIGGVRILFKGSGFERSMLVDLHRGWNVFDLGELVPEKIVITTRSRSVIEVVRGVS